MGSTTQWIFSYCHALGKYEDASNELLICYSSLSICSERQVLQFWGRQCGFCLFTALSYICCSHLLWSASWMVLNSHIYSCYKAEIPHVFSSAFFEGCSCFCHPLIILILGGNKNGFRNLPEDEQHCNAVKQCCWNLDIYVNIQALSRFWQHNFCGGIFQRSLFSTFLGKLETLGVWLHDPCGSLQLRIFCDTASHLLIIPSQLSKAAKWSTNVCKFWALASRKALSWHNHLSGGTTSDDTLSAFRKLSSTEKIPLWQKFLCHIGGVGTIRNGYTQQLQDWIFSSCQTTFLVAGWSSIFNYSTDKR